MYRVQQRNSRSKTRNGRIYRLWLKGREAERLKTVRGSGGGLAPVDETKPWDRVVF